MLQHAIEEWQHEQHYWYHYKKEAKRYEKDQIEKIHISNAHYIVIQSIKPFLVNYNTIVKCDYIE